jgi:hypothetical protein
MQWRRSIKTLARPALTLRLVHILYNLLSPSSSEQLNTSQKASSIMVDNLRECSYSYQKKRTWAGRPQAVERQPMLIHTSHAVPAFSVPWPWEVTFRGAWYGMCESNMAALWKSKFSATQYGRDTAWAWHGLCEGSALCWRTLLVWKLPTDYLEKLIWQHCIISLWKNVNVSG